MKISKIFYFVFFCLLHLKCTDISNNFDVFYRKYFNNVLNYEVFRDAEKRFSFIFHYFDVRNIANLRFENNNFIDRIENSKLTKLEIDKIKNFFIHATQALSFFDAYQNELIVENDLYKKDFLYKSFQTMLSELIEFPGIKEMNKKFENMTFFVKTNYDYNIIFQNSFSDAHSSPEYFGRGFKKKRVELIKNNHLSLEKQFDEYSKTMEEAVSFFGGDLDDRDMLNFLDSDFVYSELEYNNESKTYSKRKNFLRYNLFKDFHHTVYAAWQLYCLYYNQPGLIKRWQVFGNHETLSINKSQDKHGTCGLFVLMMSYIRRCILPTEIDFINEEKKEIISLSHAFGACMGLDETHNIKKISHDFNIMYLKINPGEVKPEYKELYSGYFYDYKQNPQLWSDYVPTFNDLDLSSDNPKVIVEKIYGRGYQFKGKIDSVLEWRKKIVLNNFQLVTLKEYENLNDFLYFHVSGHSHGENEVKSLVFKTQERVVSFSNIQHFGRNSAWLFTACSCHNQYIGYLTDAARSQECFFDCSRPEYPISAFETCNNYERFISYLNDEGRSKKDLSNFFTRYLSNYKEIGEKNVSVVVEDNRDKKITFLTNFLNQRLIYCTIPAVPGYLLGLKFVTCKKPIYCTSAVLVGISFAFFVKKAFLETLKHHKALDNFNKFQENESAYRNNKIFKLSEQINALK